MRLLRRDVLLTGIGVVLASGLPGSSSSRAQTATDDDEIKRFMAVSRCLTDRNQLDPGIGSALYNGIIQSDQERKTQLSTLHDIMADGHLAGSSDLARAAEKADPKLKDVIHDIMIGWYRGVANGKVVVYRSALMFDITKDAIYPKTYAAGGPFYWTTQPPDVVRPTGQPALSSSPFIVEPT